MSLKTLYAVAFLDAFNFAFLLPVVNAHVLSLGGSLMLCGILQSAGAGMQFFASPIVGSWSDTHGRKLILLCTFVVMFLGDAISGVDSLVMFFIGRLLFGAAHQTDPLLKAIVTDMYSDKETQAKAFNNLLALPGIAFIIAPVLGGLAYQQFTSLAIISTVLCTTDALLIATTLLYVPDIKIEKKDDTTPSTDWYKYIDLLSIKFVVEAAFNFLFMNSALILECTRAQTGVLIAYMSVAMTMGAFLSPLIKKWYYPNDMTGSKRILHAFVIMVASFIVFLISANSLILHLAIFIPACLAKLLLEVAWMEALTARTTESDRGFMMGIGISMLSAAGLVCPLISGVLADYVGIYSLAILPLLPSLVGVMLANKAQKTHVN